MDPLDWSDLAHFVALMRGQSLRAAARELQISPSTVGRRVAALEQALGVPLFVRTPEGLRPTPTAFELAAGGRDIEERIATLQRRLSPGAKAVRGLLRISTVESLTSEVLAGAMPSLLERHPGLQVTLKVEPKIVSFERDDADLALRMVKPVGKRLVARRVATLDFRLYGSRAYLARGAGRDLARASFVAYDDSYGDIPERAWMTRHGFDDAVVLRSASTRALLQAVRAGGGLGILPVFLARDSPELVAVEAPEMVAPRGIWLVTHQDVRRRPAVNAAWEHLVETFAAI